jgi:hypothetical protein
VVVGEPGWFFGLAGGKLIFSLKAVSTERAVV